MVDIIEFLKAVEKIEQDDTGWHLRTVPTSPITAELYREDNPEVIIEVPPAFTRLLVNLAKQASQRTQANIRRALGIYE